MRKMKYKSIEKDSKQIQGSGENPRLLIRGEETRCSQKSTPAKSGQAEASKLRPIPGHCSDNTMAELRFSYITPGISSRKGEETTVTSNCILYSIYRDLANNSRGAVYQSHSPAPPTEITAKADMGIKQKDPSAAM